MNDENEKIIKHLLNLTEGTKNKPPKDIYTAILKRINRNHSNDVYAEYPECLVDLCLIKAGVQINLENNTITPEKKFKGEQLIKDINNELPPKKTIGTPKADVDSTGTKYVFGLGGSAKFEDYPNFKKTIQETDLLNKIAIFSNLCSDGIAFLGIQKKEFWYRDTTIGEN